MMGSRMGSSNPPVAAAALPARPSKIPAGALVSWAPCSSTAALLAASAPPKRPFKSTSWAIASEACSQRTRMTSIVAN